MPLSRRIGDCLRALGEPGRALHCYRDALRRNSASGHATREARDLLGIPRLLPTIPVRGPDSDVRMRASARIWSPS